MTEMTREDKIGLQAILRVSLSSVEFLFSAVTAYEPKNDDEKTLREVAIRNLDNALQQAPAEFAKLKAGFATLKAEEQEPEFNDKELDNLLKDILQAIPCRPILYSSRRRERKAELN